MTTDSDMTALAHLDMIARIKDMPS